MRLAGKMRAGFGLMTVLTLALGGLFLWQTERVRQNQEQLEEVFAPLVAAGGGLERHWAQAAFNLRGYAMSGEKGLLELARRDLAETAAWLERAQAMAEQRPELAHLAQTLEKCRALSAGYQELIAQTKAKTEENLDYHEFMVAAQERFLDNAQTLLAEHAAGLARALEEGKADQAQRVQLQRLNLLTGVIAQGEGAWVKSLRIQAQSGEGLDLLAEVTASLQAMRVTFDDLVALCRDEPQLQSRVAGSRSAAEQYQALLTVWAENRQGLRELRLKREALAQEMTALTQSLADQGLTGIAAAAEASGQSIDGARRGALWGLAGAMALGLALSLTITSSIAKPLRRVIAGLASGAEQVGTAAAQVASASQGLAEGSAQQAAAVEQTSTSMEEIAAMTKGNAGHARQADQLAQEAKAVNARAEQAVSELGAAMSEMAQAGEQTGKIIRTIEEIAFQTNLLSLNAAVEAARAGQAGAGFAVVADEVRRLALRTAEAARETTSLVRGTMEKARLGSATLARTREAFAEAGLSAQKLGGLVGEIGSASAEQAQGIEQINRAMDELDQVTQRNAGNAEESAGASEELSAQAETMRRFVAELEAIAGGEGGGEGLARARGRRLRLAWRGREPEKVQQPV